MSCIGNQTRVSPRLVCLLTCLFLIFRVLHNVEAIAEKRDLFQHRLLSVPLQRVRIMNIRLGSLKEGTWRNIEGEERKELDALLSDSSSLSVKERNEKQRERRGGI